MLLVIAALAMSSNKGEALHNTGAGWECDGGGVGGER